MTATDKTRTELAEALLRIGAVTLSPSKPYTWASGLRSPIYCDNRLTLGHPDIRNRIADLFDQYVRQTFPDVEVVAGTATAGIPHAAVLATRLDKPMCYIRSATKGHGRKNLIEGPLKSGQSVVVIEDLISTGMSSLKAVEAVREVGANVLAVLAIFTYNFDFATAAFDSAAVPFHTLTDYDTLVDVAGSRGGVAKSETDLLRAWRTDPEKWGAQFE